MNSHLTRLSGERKAEIQQLFRRWKATGSAVGVLEESLRLLAKPGRNGEFRRLAQREDYVRMGIAVTWGKGPSKVKGALTSEEAGSALELLAEVRKAAQALPDAVTAEVLERVASVLLGGQRPPHEIPDDFWPLALQVIRRYDSSVDQMPLL